MSPGEREAIASARSGAIGLACLVELIADKLDASSRETDALRGVEALAEQLVEQLTAIERSAAS